MMLGPLGRRVQTATERGNGGCCLSLCVLHLYSLCIVLRLTWIDIETAEHGTNCVPREIYRERVRERNLKHMQCRGRVDAVVICCAALRCRWLYYKMGNKTFSN